MSPTNTELVPSLVTTTLLGPITSSSGTAAAAQSVPGCGAISNCVPRLQPEQAQAYIAYTFFAVPQTNASGVWPLSTRAKLAPRSVLR